MPTPVLFVGCKVTPNLTTNNFSQQCPANQRILVNTTLENLTTAAQLNQPINYAYAVSIYSFAFSTVLVLYLAAKNVGVILALMRGR
jgi:hypothetical protein